MHLPYMPRYQRLIGAAIKETVVDPDGSIGYMPFVWFKRPANENNYYLFQYNSIHDYPYDYPYAFYRSFMIFPFYVLDDNDAANVNELAVRVITSEHYQFSDSYPYLTKPTEPTQVRLSSLTKEAYDYLMHW